MRYSSIETISFTDTRGLSFPVKEMREIPPYESRFSFQRKATQDPDDVATQENVFDKSNEGETYRLWEANAVAIADMDFNLNLVLNLRVPVIE